MNSLFSLDFSLGLFDDKDKTSSSNPEKSDIQSINNPLPIIPSTNQIKESGVIENTTDNLMTKIWGGPFWIALHSITFGYPQKPTKEDKQNYKVFFSSVGNVLPCEYCRISYNKFILEGETRLTDDVFESRENITKWLYNFHNAVNEKLQVKYNISYEEVVRRFESYRIRCVKETPTSPCIMPIELKTIAYQTKEIVDAPIIPYETAQFFIDYAYLRGVSIDTLELSRQYLNNKDSHWWKLRNKICSDLIKHMRFNGIPSLEKSGPWLGKPTVQELQLIFYLSSNLSKKEFDECISKKKTYVLVK